MLTSGDHRQPGLPPYRAYGNSRYVHTRTDPRCQHTEDRNALCFRSAGKRTQEQYAALSPSLKAQYPEAYAKGAEQMLLMFGETLAHDPKYVTQVRPLPRRHGAVSAVVRTPLLS